MDPARAVDVRGPTGKAIGNIPEIAIMGRAIGTAGRA
jgi:hypothetical protein